MPGEKKEISQQGYDELQREYRDLLDVQMPAVREALKDARAQGDLSENADYEAARDQQAKLQNRIDELDNILSSVVIIDKKGKRATKGVSLQDKVTYKDLSDGSEHVLQIVSTHEANPFVEPYPRVSNESAIGKAITGHLVGDVVSVDSVEPYEVEILKIEKQ